jgi:hypothetical protein
MTQFFKVTPILVLSVVLQACNGSGSGGGSESPSVTPNPNQNQCTAALDLNEPNYFEDAEYSTDVSAEVDGKLLRYREVRVNIEALKSAMQAGKGRIRLDLYAGLNVSVLSERIEKYSDNNYVLTGRIEGEAFSSVSLAIQGDVLVGNLNTGKGNRYVISYKGNGIHNIDEYESDEDSEGDSCLTVDMTASSLMEPTAASTETEEDGENQALATTPVIDMLVAYTPNAKSAVGGEAAMIALIQTGIADTNKSFIDSGVNLQVRLVGVMPVSQNETGNWSSDLSALSSKTDSRWNEVHAERARLGADQVSLVANYSGSSTAGIGYIKSTSSTAFTITKVSAFKNFSFTHELGHNVGLNHTDGYVNSSGSFRTIMAYGTVTRIARFSNPLIPYRGYTTGTSSQNSASILNKNGTTTSTLVAALVPVSKPDIPIEPLPPGEETPVCP